MKGRLRARLFFCSVFATSLMQLNPSRAFSAPDMPLDSPDTLVFGGVRNFTLAPPKVFWYSRSCEPVPPHLSDDPRFSESPESPNFIDTETISRVALQGSPTRQLYTTSASGYCGSLAHYALSNMVADSDFVYWLTNQGLVRLPTSANPGDAPQILNASINGDFGSELAIDDNYIYSLTTQNSTSKVRRISKGTGIATTLYDIGRQAHQLQVMHIWEPFSYSSDFVYSVDGGVLRRFDLNTSTLTDIASGIVSYHAEGYHLLCVIFCIGTDDDVFFSTGRYVSRKSNKGQSSPTQIYDTGNDNDTVYDLISEGERIFFLQEHRVNFGLASVKTDYVVRRPRTASGVADFLAIGPAVENVTTYAHLATANGLLAWQSNDAILRLPSDAASFPATDMNVTGMLITQGIQRPDNSVPLIQGRRTFVRLFVKSAGPDVPGVTAGLYRTDSNGNILDSVLPINAVGTNLTVHANPRRVIVDDAFLFELPWSWIPTSTASKLYLKASLNPYHVPLETNYGNNDVSASFAFSPSSALKVNFVSWGYATDSGDFYPRFHKDVWQTFSWLLRAYPIATKIVIDGYNGSSTEPGLHPEMDTIFDGILGTKVISSTTEPSCQFLNTRSGDFRAACASCYTDHQMAVLRNDLGLATTRFFYGFISDGAAFPRGVAECGGTAVSSGPAGCCRYGWDFDGSYAEWYAAHEIGHTLGRGHPNLHVMTQTAILDGCDLYDGGSTNGGDNLFPHSRGRIGSDANTEGFDAGDPGFGVDRAVYPGNDWHDVMSYCDNQWVSDYTYIGMYDWMTAHPALNVVEKQFIHDGVPASDPIAQASPISITGDLLVVQGVIDDAAHSGSITNLSRRTSVVDVPPLVPGEYAIRLYRSGGVQVGNYPFTPSPVDDATSLSTFYQVIDYASGLRAVKLVRLSDGMILASAPASAFKPLISNVILRGEPSSITGTVTLTWTASDADNDPLTFDVFYHKEGTRILQPLKTSISGRSTSVDLSALGGGSAKFRVVANDGVNTAFAESQNFVFADKPPVSMILSPADGLHIHYGQLVNFNGTAIDWQEGGVSGAGLQWSSNLGGSLGSGEQISSQSLPVGANVIMLTATNNAGLMATDTITVFVDDDLDLLGPTLIYGPTQIGWQLAANESLTQSNTLELSNAGSGPLYWSASTDAPWLVMSAASGMAPSSIGLFVFPESIANGSVLTGAITLTTPYRTVSVPVRLSKSVSAYPVITHWSVAMPIILR